MSKRRRNRRAKFDKNPVENVEKVEKKERISLVIDLEREIFDSIVRQRKSERLYLFEIGLLSKVVGLLEELTHMFKSGERYGYLEGYGNMVFTQMGQSLESKRLYLKSGRVAFGLLVKSYQRFVDKGKDFDELRLEADKILRKDVDFQAKKEEVRAELKNYLLKVLEAVEEF